MIELPTIALTRFFLRLYKLGFLGALGPWLPF